MPTTILVQDARISTAGTANSVNISSSGQSRLAGRVSKAPEEDIQSTRREAQAPAPVAPTAISSPQRADPSSQNNKDKITNASVVSFVGKMGVDMIKGAADEMGIVDMGCGLLEIAKSPMYQFQAIGKFLQGDFKGALGCLIQPALGLLRVAKGLFKLGVEWTGLGSIGRLFWALCVTHDMQTVAMEGAFSFLKLYRLTTVLFAVLTGGVGLAAAAGMLAGLFGINALMKSLTKQALGKISAAAGVAWAGHFAKEGFAKAGMCGVARLEKIIGGRTIGCILKELAPALSRAGRDELKKILATMMSFNGLTERARYVLKAIEDSPTLKKELGHLGLEDIERVIGNGANKAAMSVSAKTLRTIATQELESMTAHVRVPHISLKSRKVLISQLKRLCNGRDPYEAVCEIMRESPKSRQVAALQAELREIASHGDGTLREFFEVGVRSNGKSYSKRKAIALIEERLEMVPIADGFTSDFVRCDLQRRLYRIVRSPKQQAIAELRRYIPEASEKEARDMIFALKLFSHGRLPKIFDSWLGRQIFGVVEAQAPFGRGFDKKMIEHMTDSAHSAMMSEFERKGFKEAFLSPLRDFGRRYGLSEEAIRRFEGEFGQAFTEWSEVSLKRIIRKGVEDALRRNRMKRHGLNLDLGMEEAEQKTRSSARASVVRVGDFVTRSTDMTSHSNPTTLRNLRIAAGTSLAALPVAAELSRRTSSTPLGPSFLVRSNLYVRHQHLSLDSVGREEEYDGVLGHAAGSAMARQNPLADVSALSNLSVARAPRLSGEASPETVQEIVAMTRSGGIPQSTVTSALAFATTTSSSANIGGNLFIGSRPEALGALREEGRAQTKAA